MKSNSGLAAKGIERVLELSADAQINRREVAKDSPAYHNLMGAIAAYGISARTSHSTSTAGRILHNSRSI
jgi:hypothetical protein